MPFFQLHWNGRPVASGIASLCLHFAVLGGLALLPSIERLNPQPEEDGVEVELVTPEQVAPRPEPQPQATTVPQLPAPQPTPPVPPPIPPPPAVVRARRLLSDDVLANPLSKGTQEALGQLEEAERIEQLCNLEAMGQVHAWKAEFQPDRVVAYAMEGTKLSRTAMQADGAVFRSKQQWYRLKFKCELSPDRRKVAGFEFIVGEPVPRRDWRALALPAVH